MAGPGESSWTRALMASSGIAMGHDEMPRHATPEWREAAAKETPLSRLHKLAQARDPEVREVIARRDDCPMGLLAALSHDRSAHVRAGVAGNRRLTRAVAEHLAQDRDVRVLKSLARNQQTPLWLLERMALHRKEDVRRVASRRLDERLGSGSAVLSRTEALEAHAGPRRSGELPAELRDRVEAAPMWTPIPQEG